MVKPALSWVNNKIRWTKIIFRGDKKNKQPKQMFNLSEKQQTIYKESP